jgi:hypothetical protein
VRAARLAAGLVLVALAFGVGIAVGEALHDNPRPGGTITSVRTLRPAQLPPAAVTVTRTVTVTGG